MFNSVESILAQAADYASAFLVTFNTWRQRRKEAPGGDCVSRHTIPARRLLIPLIIATQEVLQTVYSQYLCCTPCRHFFPSFQEMSGKVLSKCIDTYSQASQTASGATWSLKVCFGFRFSTFTLAASICSF